MQEGFALSYHEEIHAFILEYLNLNLNSLLVKRLIDNLLVKRQIDNPSPGAVTGGN